MPLNKRLIYGSLSPYGEDGPERDRTAFDATAWWATIGPDGHGAGDRRHRAGHVGAGHGRSPDRDGDVRRHRHRPLPPADHRGGREVTTSLLANGLWSNGCQVQAALCDLDLVPRAERGQRNPLVEFYLTADGREFALAMVNIAREWPLLLDAIGRPESAGGPAVFDPARPFRERRPARPPSWGTSSGASLGSTGRRA